MEWQDVLRRIEAGEDARTEFKRGLGDFSAIGKTLCAFANGNGGLIVVGVVDPGVIIGVKEDPESVQERLTSFLHTGCGKPITAECNRHHTDNGWVHWIEVRRHQRGYDPFSYDGRFWIRRGRGTVAPSPSELQELLNAFGLVLTEQQIIPTATVNEIDMGAFRSFMRAQGMRIAEEPQPDIENDLRNASVCDWLDRVLRPTLYGVMVFGKNPQGFPHTTNLFIQCVAYAGTDQASEVLSAGEGKGRLDEQVNRSMGWFRSLERREAYRGLYRQGHSPRAGRGSSGSAGERRHSSRLRIDGISGAAGNVPRPCRRHESRNSPQSYDGRAGAVRRRSAFAQRNDGERDGREAIDGTTRSRMAADATPYAGIQRYRAGSGQRRKRSIHPGDVSSLKRTDQDSLN